MLFNIIRDFIVQYITGGMDSTGAYYDTYIGKCNSFVNGEYDDSMGYGLREITYKVGYYTDGGDIADLYINGADWLATTLTIICMCLIVVFAIWLVRWIFKSVSSAFLLRR